MRGTNARPRVSLILALPVAFGAAGCGERDEDGRQQSRSQSSDPEMSSTVVGGAITGVVTYGDSRKRARGAVVSVRTRTRITTTSTDKHGRFTLGGLSGGLYRVTVTHRGYKWSRTVTVVAGKQTRVRGIWLKSKKRKSVLDGCWGG